MGNIIKIENHEIETILQKVSRQYLVGDLQRPQELSFIKDNNLEVGITDYKEYSTEPVHYHTDAVEYQYMLSGWTKYMDPESETEYEFKKGDFYCIEKNTIYAQKSKKGTRILFIKVPSINDKTVIEAGDKIKEWYEEGLKTVRKDYSHEAIMPDATSMRPAASVAIVNDNRILMLQRVDNGKWTLPGGTMELDESLVGCASREVREECGLDVEILDIIGTYSDPNIRIEYSDGEVRREFTIVYYGKARGDKVVIDEESSSFKWVSLIEVLDLPMASSQRRRIEDVLAFLDTGKKRMG